MIQVVHINDKLSMDGQNPSSVAHLLGDWIPLLRQHEVACSVCTLRDPDPGADYLEQRSIRVRRFGHGKLSPLNLFAIANFLREESADIAHLHGFASANFGRLVARRLGIANVVHEHATLLDVPAYQRLADRILRHWADAAIAVSRSVREFMIHGRFIPAERINVIGNGVDLERFASPDRKAMAAVRRMLDIPEGHRLVGTVTRLRVEKGPEFFLRAIPPVLEELPTVTFLVVGDGPLRGALETLAKELGVERRVRFLGFRTDVPELLGLLDVLVISSLTEGFPLSLVEGMAAGLPLVATRVGGMSEVARDGDDVLFVPPRDPAAIAAKTIALLENPGMADRLGREAAATAAGYSMAGSAGKLAGLYGRLVTERAAPRLVAEA